VSRSAPFAVDVGRWDDHDHALTRTRRRCDGDVEDPPFADRLVLLGTPEAGTAAAGDHDGPDPACRRLCSEVAMGRGHAGGG
jgi:hypothetical protein